MKTTDYIIDSVNRLPKGYVFTYEDFIGEVKSKEAVIKALNRMVASGKIRKLSKGKYYKPEKTIFGELGPDQYQVVKDLIEKDGKLLGYLTGYSIYNSLGLTTQVSNTIQIGKNEVRPSFKREQYTIAFVRQKNNITKESVPLLQLLDSIRYIKKIPDSSIEFVCKRLLVLLKEKDTASYATLVRLAQKYPPATRALLGALLGELKETNLLVSLYDSLNPITTYEFKGANKVLKNTEKWNIK
jgi:hypothetical protein